MAGTRRDGFMNANIHIERLVLDGLSVPYHQQSLLQAAFEKELGRLLTANGLSNSLLSDGSVSHISASDIQLADESDPTELGEQIAQAVYGGVNR